VIQYVIIILGTIAIIFNIITLIKDKNRALFGNIMLTILVIMLLLIIVCTYLDFNDEAGRAVSRFILERL
jgi:hypothetical protein